MKPTNRIASAILNSLLPTGRKDSWITRGLTKVLRPLTTPLSLLTAGQLTLCLFAGSPATVEAADLSLAEALEDANLAWTTGGQVPWYGQQIVSHDGADAAQSGIIADAHESWLQTTVVGPGTLEFWWQVSSEQDFDWLRFHIDDVLKEQISGEVDWQQQQFAIPEGSHTLEWRYVKDPADSAGQNRGWLDQVSFVAATGGPMIATQPASQTVWEGANVSFTVTALGSPPMSYQWFVNGTPVPSATNLTLALATILPANAGSYRVEVSNDAGTVTSSPAVLTLGNNAPANQILLYVDSPVPSPFEIALLNLGFDYQRFTSASEFTSALNNANRDTDLVIVDQPGNFFTPTSLVSFINGRGRALIQANTLAGSPALATALKVAVDWRSNTPISVYEWGGSPLFEGLSGPLNRTEIGLDEDTQRLQVVPGGYAVAGFSAATTPGEAAIVVGNNGRTIVNGWWLAGIISGNDAVRLAENQILFLTGPVSATTPIIQIQPRSQTLLPGGSVHLDVRASGGLPLSYQWYKDSVELPNATSASLDISNIQVENEGNYTVVVANSYGSVTSDPASLSLLIKPTGQIASILLFTDTFLGVPSPYETALTEMGLNFQRFTSAPAFAAAVSQANHNNTLLIIAAIDSFYDFTSTANFISAGGQAIVQDPGRCCRIPAGSPAPLTSRPCRISDSSSRFMNGVPRLSSGTCRALST